MSTREKSQDDSDKLQEAIRIIGKLLCQPSLPDYTNALKFIKKHEK